MRHKVSIEDSEKLKHIPDTLEGRAHEQNCPHAQSSV